MISCTEFIPAYSELFSFLEEKYGHDEVIRFWEYLFKPTGEGIPLINFLKKEGIRGCFTYWSGTLNEEAADVTLYLNEKAGWFRIVMHHCPSKGRLLSLRDEIGIKPYHSYCLHCDSYRAAVEAVGLRYIYDFIDVDKAACSMLIYDPAVFDGRVVADENTQVLDICASQNEYFHRDFHSSMNMGLEYLGEIHTEDDVREYLTRFTNNVYAPVLREIEKTGLAAIEEKILDTYVKEKARDAVETKRTDDSLDVNVFYCPAVKHLHETGREVSKWYIASTTDVMRELARHAGCRFTLLDYDETTGRAHYRIER